METKFIEIKDNNDVVSGNNVIFHFAWKTLIMPSWTFKRNNYTWSNSAGGGDYCISYGSIRVDGDIILSVGWGDGLSVRRLNDDGSLTELYHDNYPVASYAYMNNLTIDKNRHKAYVASYNKNGIAVYDYSDCYGGTDTVTKDGVLTTADGLPTDRVGLYYKNGLEIVGDWLYLVPYGSYTSTMPRWNTQTQVADNLTVTNLRNTGGYGSLYYDEDNDRIYASWHRNGEVWVTNNASSSTAAKTYTIRIEDFGMGNDIYTFGVVPDKDNSNYVILGGHYGRITKFDISAVLSETSTLPTAVKRNSTLYNKTLSFSEWYVWGYHDLKPHPTLKSDFIVVLPDRGWYMEFGWFDQENYLFVGPPKSDRYAYYSDGSSAYTWSDQALLRYTYSPMPILVTASGGNKYWVLSGYSWDGYKFRTWDYNTYPDGMVLNTSAEIIFGTYQLDSGNDIETVQLNNIANQVYILAGTSLTVYVSNNSGASWEQYDYETEETHVFSSSGNSVQIKIVINGQKHKSAYISGKYKISAIITEKTNFHFNKVKKYTTNLGIKGKS